MSFYKSNKKGFPLENFLRQNQASKKKKNQEICGVINDEVEPGALHVAEYPR